MNLRVLQNDSPRTDLLSKRPQLFGISDYFLHNSLFMLTVWFCWWTDH